MKLDTLILRKLPFTLALASTLFSLSACESAEEPVAADAAMENLPDTAPSIDGNGDQGAGSNSINTDSPMTNPVSSTEDGSIEYLAKEYAEKMQSVLPWVQKDFTLFEVTNSQGTLLYKHNITTIIPQENYDLLDPWLRDMSQRTACSNKQLAFFISKNGSLVYSYYINGELFNTYYLSKC